MEWFEIRDKINKIYNSCNSYTQIKAAHRYCVLMILRYCPNEYLYNYLKYIHYNHKLKLPIIEV